ncbi:MAG: recombination protein RecR, partial [Bdellovibrionales bacterium]|nr:recombination protein RecR [Bdellovibrionales bacterium]
MSYPPSLQKLIKELSKLPSIGEKSAARLAYHIAVNDKGLAKKLSDALQQVDGAVRQCERCFFLSESELCAVCSNPSRDATQLCVVEKPLDVLAIERVGEFRGLYHVLHGLWAPLRGQGPQNIRLAELLERLEKDGVQEVIIATNSTVEGDATALYIARLLNEKKIRSTRLAQGMPRGGE